MRYQIRPAQPGDREAILRIQAGLHRPRRAARLSEYLVAAARNGILGCAAVRLFREGGYLYGLAVSKPYQRRGVGSALTEARIERVRGAGRPLAIVLAMFWNVAFFRRFGFRTISRRELPPAVRRLADLRNPLYKRSAVLWLPLEP